jgi:hypothetical protein
MEPQPIADEVPLELVEWFSVEIDFGDFPELHLIGLQGDDLLRCFEVLQSLAAGWSDRRFHIDAQAIDVTIDERPDVAELVIAREVGVACVSTDQLEVHGVQLPLLSMFLQPSAIQFFWRPEPAWTPVRLATFLGLLVGLLDLAANSQLSPDPRYPLEARERLGRALGEYIGMPSRINTTIAS